MGNVNDRRTLVWFSVVSVILVLAGVVFSFFGLRLLPVAEETLLPWESAIYGAIMMGWGTTLLLVGRIAFRRHETELLKALLAGIAVWLIVEALFSAYFKVWFNIGVDAGVLLPVQYSSGERHSFKQTGMSRSQATSGR